MRSVLLRLLQTYFALLPPDVAAVLANTPKSRPHGFSMTNRVCADH
jgi:hypothetical protein